MYTDISIHPKHKLVMLRSAGVLRPTAVVTRHFTAMVARSAKDAAAAGSNTSELREFESVSELPQQDPDATVEVEVAYSDLNYKDGLIVLGRSGVVKSFPIVPGIDFAGTVVRSRSPHFQEGDAVALTGNKAGQYFDGGYAQRAACQAEHLVKLPPGLSTLQAMVLGTAGMTATMCVRHLETAGEVTPRLGPVLVTGASGGLGQIAVALLAARGFEVVASTGRAEEHGAGLRALGASEVVGRLEASEKALQSQRWAGVVDTVGGTTLAAAITQTAYRGAVASTGNAGGPD
jgi:acrylyl-CoA reductase (NADPH)